MFLLHASPAGLDSADAQDFGKHDRALGRHMLRSVREQLEKHYYDSTFHGIDLRVAAARADSQIQVANSSGEMFQAIAAFVQKLEDSHTFVTPPGLAATVEYGWDVMMIGDSAFVVAVKPGSDAAAKGLKVGDRVIALDRYLMTHRNLTLMQYSLEYINPRSTVRFDIESSDGTRRAVDVETKITHRPRVRDEIRLYREYYRNASPPIATYAEPRAGVVLIKMGGFDDRHAMDKVMKVARNATTLVLDLRGNSGGYIDGLARLVGHVFDQEMAIATIRTRRKLETLRSKPVETPFKGILMVLTDSRSASAAEVFAYIVQLKGRGVVVGDRSAGGVMQGREHVLALSQGSRTSLYSLMITDADVIMPDSTRLEGLGVTPDSYVLPSRADLAEGNDPVLGMALTLAGYPTDPAQAGKLLTKSGRKP